MTTPTLPTGLREALSSYLCAHKGYIKDGIAVTETVRQMERVIAPFFPAQPSVEQGDTAEGATPRTEAVFSSLVKLGGGWGTSDIHKLRNFARTLERELAAVT